MHTCYHLKEDDTGHQLTDVIEVHFCELEKLRDTTDLSDLNDPSVDWLRFTGAKTKGEMEMVANNNEMIKDAYNYLKVISKDEQKRLAYEARQMDLMDRKTREEEAEERGRKEVALNMLKENIDVNIIERCTGLSSKDILKLKEGIEKQT